jgi:hypothetical protein
MDTAGKFKLTTGYFYYAVAWWFIFVPLPIVTVIYAIHRYVTWVGPGQARVAITAAGGLLIKTFVIPPVWALSRVLHSSVS